MSVANIGMLQEPFRKRKWCLRDFADTQEGLRNHFATKSYSRRAAKLASTLRFSAPSLRHISGNFRRKYTLLYKKVAKSLRNKRRSTESANLAFLLKAAILMVIYGYKDQPRVRKGSNMRQNWKKNMKFGENVKTAMVGALKRHGGLLRDNLRNLPKRKALRREGLKRRGARIRTRSLDLVPIDLDINKTLRKLNRKCKQQVIQEVPAMGDENHGDNGVPNRALKDYSIPNVGVLSIQRPPIQANNFEIKLAIIQMIRSSVQFGGLANDDPNLHIANFLEICDTFKHNGVIDDAIRLRLFPFSLNNKAKAWLISLPPGTITTWDGLVNAFLTKYFPPAKSIKMRNDITNFLQQDQESLYEAWERKLELGEVKPTTVSLQLADRSIKHPRGIIEDVLVKVDKFIFSVDFIVLEMEEDRDVPLILGRPFLATGRTLIDVH
uniref:Retrotransposon gag domain-containing protein n=1 Tax=Vitis vinifera TaxID=29760 RepID=A5B3J2_VITVI|nr:hypothetical protein VITISV_040272 [Vitis vinifera]